MCRHITETALHHRQATMKNSTQKTYEPKLKIWHVSWVVT